MTSYIGLLEQELTPKQMKWVLAHPEHEQVKRLIIGAWVADWDGIKEKSIDHFKRYAVLNFRRWWENEMVTLKSPEG